MDYMMYVIDSKIHPMTLVINETVVSPTYLQDYLFSAELINLNPFFQFMNIINNISLFLHRLEVNYGREILSPDDTPFQPNIIIPYFVQRLTIPQQNVVSQNKDKIISKQHTAGGKNKYQIPNTQS